MPNPRLAARYAKSLIDISIEQGQLEHVYADMQFLQRIIKENPELGALLRSPIVNADKKEKILTAVTDGRITPLTASFNKLLVTKGREENLPEIITAFIKQYKDYKNIHVVQLTTATPVSEEVKNAIVAQIRSTSNMQNIELETKIDPNLIGGFVLQSGDKLVDASISYDLRQIAKQFESNEFIYAIR
jgi:F-type H+-transporting ATPase subunit delta